MSIETKKIHEQLNLHVLCCDDTGDKMINVWARLNDEPLPVQQVEALWNSTMYRGSGKHDLSGHLYCTNVDNGPAAMVDFITNEQPNGKRDLQILVKNL